MLVCLDLLPLTDEPIQSISQVQQSLLQLSCEKMSGRLLPGCSFGMKETENDKLNAFFQLAWHLIPFAIIIMNLKAM